MSLPSRERGLKYIAGYALLPLFLSLPSRERGLKLVSTHGRDYIQRVAPFAGAWIEIIMGLTLGMSIRKSLPSRERGLKLAPCYVQIMQLLSLPSRERGLKYDTHCTNLLLCPSLPSRERGLKLFAIV